MYILSYFRKHKNIRFYYTISCMMVYYFIKFYGVME
jgi:hypothetical protein